tara:strand:+ start:180 stop:506 length:327 start_codon:yes stop_codon:yes gene_type:complete
MQRAEKLELLQGEVVRTNHEKLIDSQQVAIRKLQQENGDLAMDLNNLKFGIKFGTFVSVMLTGAIVLLYLAATAEASSGSIAPPSDMAFYTSTTMSIVVLRAFWGFWR